MKPDEFFELTPYEFDCYVRGFFKQFETEQRIEWERQRLFAVMIINSQPIKKQIRDPKQLVKFEWEIEKPPQLTPEQIEYIKNW